MDNTNNENTTPVATQNTMAEPKKKKKHTGFIFFLFVVAGFCFYTYYEYTEHEKEIYELNEKCTPVSTTGEVKELSLDSTIVQDLYSKVYTTIKEDAAETELNDSLKLYLAYRQIPNYKIYDSNCNYFSATKMPYYTCLNNETTTPTAFKEESLKVEYKKLFGEDAIFQNNDIQIGRVCLGGYQYIESRGEYVSGYCKEEPTTIYTGEKKLVKATSQESTIVLYETVKYYAGEGQKLKENLVSGTYMYTFKLDTNYNYVYKSKELKN